MNKPTFIELCGKRINVDAIAWISTVTSRDDPNFAQIAGRAKRAVMFIHFKEAKSLKLTDHDITLFLELMEIASNTIRLPGKSVKQTKKETRTDRVVPAVAPASQTPPSWVDIVQQRKRLPILHATSRPMFDTWEVE